MATCDICKSEYKKRIHNNRYCSPTCRQIAKKKGTERWISSNKEHIKLYSAEYYRQNKEHKIKRDREYRSRKMKEDPEYKIRQNLRKRLNKAIKIDQKSGSAVKDLGCSIKELRVYLESQFQPGMTWDNYGSWHIDHVVPLASFDLTDRKQFLLACHYTNLQPMWETDNLKKGSKENFDETKQNY